MDMKLLKRVCNTPGVSGFEDEAQDVVAEVLKASCDEVSRDRMGNVIGLKKATCPPKGGKRPLRAILAAHVDEIGAMVKHIDDKGFIHFIQLGGLSVPSIISQRVVIHGRKPVRDVIVPDPRPENKDKLQGILLYHVVKGEIPSTSIKGSAAPKTLQGAALDVKAGAKGVTVNGARVIKADVTAKNGVIHVIDSVLLPPKA